MVVVLFDWCSVHAFGIVAVARVELLVVLAVGVCRGLASPVHEALVSICAAVAAHAWLNRSRWHAWVHRHMRRHHMALRVDVVSLDRSRMMVLALAQVARVDWLRHVILLSGCRVHVVMVHGHGSLIELVRHRGSWQIVDWLRMSMVAHRMLTVQNFILRIASLPAKARRTNILLLAAISVSLRLRAPALLLLLLLIRMIIACTH